jgi:hypothetical protein
MMDFLKPPTSKTEQIHMNNHALISHNTKPVGLNRCGFHAKIAGFVLLVGGLFWQGKASADQVDQGSVGYLKVFSSTQESQWGEGSYYYLHTGYRIFDRNGKAVKWVENHSDRNDEDPEKVELAPGTYIVWAQSDRDGYVKVPVTIKAARISAVHLEKGDDRKIADPSPAVKAVCRN